MRIYSLTDDGEGGTAENLIRKYRPATEVPTDLYLAAGRYRVAVEAGDGSEATFTRKSYAGGETFTLAAGDVKPLPIVCRITNIAVKVVFDGTVAQRFDEGYLAYVSASDDFSKTDAENSLVPTLKYTSDGTGYFLLPEGTKHLSWGFYGTSSDADVSAKGTKTGRIELPEPGMQYTLTFRYSKDADGELTVNVQVRRVGEFARRQLQFQSPAGRQRRRVQHRGGDRISYRPDSFCDIFDKSSRGRCLYRRGRVL